MLPMSLGGFGSNEGVVLSAGSSVDAPVLRRLLRRSGGEEESVEKE